MTPICYLCELNAASLIVHTINIDNPHTSCAFHMSKKKKNSAPPFKKQTPEELLRNKGRSWELYKCLATEEDFEDYGKGYVIIARKNNVGEIFMAWYKLDIWCRGVMKTGYIPNLDEQTFEDECLDLEGYIDYEFEPVPYDRAHNWVWGAEDFADQAGLTPPREWSFTQYMLEDDENEDIPILDLPFGSDGLHFLSLGISEQSLSHTLFPILDKNLGVEGWDYEFREDYLFESDNDELEDDRYGPDDFGYGRNAVDKDYGMDAQELLRRNRLTLPTELVLENPSSLRFIPKEGEDFDYSLLEGLDPSADRSLRRDMGSVLLYNLHLARKGERSYDIYRAIFCSAAILSTSGDPSYLGHLIEILRLDNEESEYYIPADFSIEFFPALLYNLGKNRVTQLCDAANEYMECPDNKANLCVALSEIAMRDPSRRKEVFSAFSKMIHRYSSVEEGLEGMMFDDWYTVSILEELLRLDAKELLRPSAIIYNEDYYSANRMMSEDEFVLELSRKDGPDYDDIKEDVDKTLADLYREILKL